MKRKGDIHTYIHLHIHIDYGRKTKSEGAGQPRNKMHNFNGILEF